MSKRQLTCEICSETFECRGLPGCWCSKIRVSKEKLKEISETAEDCVCPKCLTC